LEVEIINLGSCQRNIKLPNFDDLPLGWKCGHWLFGKVTSAGLSCYDVAMSYGNLHAYLTSAIDWELSLRRATAETGCEREEWN
jgi:hypothetical protein